MQTHSTRKKPQKVEQEYGQLYLPINSILHNPLQPRHVVADGKLINLAENIKICGILEPVLVCQDEFEVDQYTLLAGHRRLAAATLAGLDRIPARILPAQVHGFLLTAVAENLLREDLNTVEMAMLLGKLSGWGVDRKSLCKITGLKSPSISESLRINMIPQDILKKCVSNRDTIKRFLIQLSLYGNEHEIYAAYQYYLEHKQLPPRQKRSYAAKNAKKKLLELLNKLNQCLTETANIDYSAESELDDMFRAGIADLLNTLKNQGWFFPREFDASNRRLDSVGYSGDKLDQPDSSSASFPLEGSEQIIPDPFDGSSRARITGMSCC